MNTQEKHQLLAEKTSLERMLANLPESSVIDRMSLEARKSEIEEALATHIPPDPDVDLLVRIIDEIWKGAATQPHVLQHLAKACSAAKIQAKEEEK